MTLWTIAIVSVAVALYVCGGRKWLRPKPWMAWLYQSRFGQWVELTFFKKSESILWGRFLQALGYTLTMFASFEGIDLTPLALVLPDNLDWIVPLLPLFISAAGHIQVHLRLDTTKPIELVALPNDVPPDIAAAEEMVEHAKLEAVEAVKQAKQARAI